MDFCRIQRRSLTEEGLAQTWYDACGTAAVKAVCFWHLAFFLRFQGTRNFAISFAQLCFAPPISPVPYSGALHGVPEPNGVGNRVTSRTR